MNIIDIVVILMIILSGIVGMKRGFFKELVMTIGWLLVFVIAFYLKNPIAEFLSLNLPFFNFWGAFKNVTVINIILYQVIAFLIIYSVLMIIFSIIVKLTGIFETFLNITVILGIPSKILGFFLGLFEGFILMFIIVFVLAQPIFNIGLVNDSYFSKNILNNTPLLGNLTQETNKAISEITLLKEEYTSDSSKEEFNKECIRVMLNHNIITVEYVEKLVEKNKIKMEGINDIINEYR